MPARTADGWQLVPVKPTKKMLSTNCYPSVHSTRRALWQSMLDAAGSPKPFGYLVEKSGINNGYYFVSPKEFEHVEPRFRHIYLPVYAGVAPEKLVVGES